MLLGLAAAPVAGVVVALLSDQPLAQLREEPHPTRRTEQGWCAAVGTGVGGSGLPPYFPPIHSGLSAYFPPIGRIEVGKSLQTASAHVRRWPALTGRISSAGRTCPANRTSGPEWAILVRFAGHPLQIGTF